MVTANDILAIIEENKIQVDLSKLDHNEQLIDQGIDSLDMTTIFFALEERYQIEISREDIGEGRLASISTMVEYLSGRQ